MTKRQRDTFNDLFTHKYLQYVVCFLYVQWEEWIEEQRRLTDTSCEGTRVGRVVVFRHWLSVAHIKNTRFSLLSLLSYSQSHIQTANIYHSFINHKYFHFITVVYQWSIYRKLSKTCWKNIQIGFAVRSADKAVF